MIVENDLERTTALRKLAPDVSHVRVEDGEHRERITTMLEPLMLQLEFF